MDLSKLEIETLLFIAIHEDGVEEGFGGKRKRGVLDEWKVGTGLRHPDYPLYNLAPSVRVETLQNLMNLGLIKYYDGKYFVEEKGLEYAESVDKVMVKINGRLDLIDTEKLVLFTIPYEVIKDFSCKLELMKQKQNNEKDKDLLMSAAKKAVEYVYDCSVTENDLERNYHNYLIVKSFLLAKKIANGDIPGISDSEFNAIKNIYKL